MSKNILTATLKNLDFLHGMAPEHLDQIASNAEVRDYGKSEVVFREGEPADNTFLVLSGRLALELSPSTIYSKHLVDVFPGEMLGWSSLVDHQPFAATAVAAEPSRVLRIEGARLRAICEKDPMFGYEFMRRTVLALAKRLKATWEQLAHLYVSQYLPVNAPSDADD
jgi:CRP/FNR family cyclic AMP-dependent transcriptional regulator